MKRNWKKDDSNLYGDISFYQVYKLTMKHICTGCYWGQKAKFEKYFNIYIIMKNIQKVDNGDYQMIFKDW